MPSRNAILEEVHDERVRQSQIWGIRHAHGTGDCSSAGVAMAVKVAVLTEECGEVARAYLDDSDPEALRTELIHLAAVAVAIIEGIDNVR